MLLLVLAHGNEIGVHDQNVRRHQDGIGKQTMRRIKTVRQLVLVAVATLQETHRRQTRKIPSELLNLRNIALTIHDRLLRVETAGEIVKRHVTRRLTKRNAVANRRHCVEIRDKHEVFALLLKVEHRLHRTKIVTPMELARGLDTRQNSHNRYYIIKAAVNAGEMTDKPPFTR